jgi:hypothetical protein
MPNFQIESLNDQIFRTKTSLGNDSDIHLILLKPKANEPTSFKTKKWVQYKFKQYENVSLRKDKPSAYKISVKRLKLAP